MAIANYANTCYGNSIRDSARTNYRYHDPRRSDALQTFWDSVSQRFGSQGLPTDSAAVEDLLRRRDSITFDRRIKEEDTPDSIYPEPPAAFKAAPALPTKDEAPARNVQAPADAPRQDAEPFDPGESNPGRDDPGVDPVLLLQSNELVDSGLWHLIPHDVLDFDRTAELLRNDDPRVRSMADRLVALRSQRSHSPQTKNASHKTQQDSQSGSRLGSRLADHRHRRLPLPRLAPKKKLRDTITEQPYTTSRLALISTPHNGSGGPAQNNETSSMD